MSPKKHKKPTFLRIILLLFIYTLTFITIFFFIDYYDFYMINITFLAMLSIILGIIFTVLHLRSGRKTKVDDIVDKL
jgi:hypothetical protein